MRARPYKVELVAGAFEAESAAQDIRILKLYRFWEEAKEILLNDHVQPTSIFQHILHALKYNGGFNYDDYLTTNNQTDIVSDVHNRLKTQLNDEIANMKMPRPLPRPDDHIPDDAGIRFILEEYSYLKLHPMRG